MRAVFAALAIATVLTGCEHMLYPEIDRTPTWSGAKFPVTVILVVPEEMKDYHSVTNLPGLAALHTINVSLGEPLSETLRIQLSERAKIVSDPAIADLIVEPRIIRYNYALGDARRDRKTQAGVFADGVLNGALFHPIQAEMYAKPFIHISGSARHSSGPVIYTREWSGVVASDIQHPPMGWNFTEGDAIREATSRVIYEAVKVTVNHMSKTVLVR